MVCPLERADVVSLATVSIGAVVMFNFPVLECLVSFAIVFAIGFLLAKSNRNDGAAALPNGVVRS